MTASDYPPADNSRRLRDAVLDDIHKYDPVCWATEELGLQLDDWQKAYLLSSSKRKVLNCCRQSGKSTIAAVKALHLAIHRPNSTILLLSPSLRQSSELFRKVMDLVNRLPNRPKLLEENKLSLTMANASRIVSLPSSEATIRGYSNVPLVIEDESAAVMDDLHMAVLPMLAVSNGEIDLLSTPRGRSGHFAEAWASDSWERTMVKSEQVPRISPEFLTDMKVRLGSRMFSQEFECVFLDQIEGGMLKREWFQLVDDFPKGTRTARYWDLAATQGDGDYTAGVKVAESQGRYYILDVQRARRTPGSIESLVRQTAELDGISTQVGMEQEPGSSGVGAIDRYARDVLKGFAFKGFKVTGPKEQRAMPFAAAAEAGNVKLLRGVWNAEFLDEMVSFPEGEHDDQVDACSGAFSMLRASNSDRFIGYVGGRK